MRKRRFGRAVALLVAAVLAVAGCTGGSGGDIVTDGTAAPPARVTDVNLKGVCPDKIVIQAGWYPTADVGWPFQLYAADVKINPGKKLISGSLVVNGADSGVDLEVRAGGQAKGFQSGGALAKQDPSITAYLTNIDEMIAEAGTVEGQAVVAPINGSPMALIFDPVKFPAFFTISDIGLSDIKVLYTDNAFGPFNYMAGTGLLKKSQLQGFLGDTGRFVAERGGVVVQGYSTNETYVYEHDPKWGRAVEKYLIQDYGYPNYAGVLAVLKKNKAGLTDCLKKLVPIVQQAQIDSMADPTQAAARIVKTVKAFEAPFSYDAGNAAYGYCQLAIQGLVSNPIEGPIGTMEKTKLLRVLQELKKVYAGQKNPVPDALTVEALATNEFLNKDLRLPEEVNLVRSACAKAA